MIAGGYIGLGKPQQKKCVRTQQYMVDVKRSMGRGIFSMTQHISSNPHQYNLVGGGGVGMAPQRIK